MVVFRALDTEVLPLLGIFRYWGDFWGLAVYCPIGTKVGRALVDEEARDTRLSPGVPSVVYQDQLHLPSNPSHPSPPT